MLIVKHSFVLIEKRGIRKSTICNVMAYFRVESLHACGHLLSKSSG